MVDKEGLTRFIPTDNTWKSDAIYHEKWQMPSYNDMEWDGALVLPKKGLATWEGAGANANQWYCYRKTFDLDRTPQHATAKIAVDSKYWLWMNGELVVFEGGLKRGPTPGDTYYDVVDLAPYCREGTNTLSILAWFWGRNGYCHKSSGQAGLLFEADIDGKSVISDDSWRMVRHPAYGMSGPPHPNYRLPEFNIHFDARKDIGDWIEPDYDDTAWELPHVFGPPPVSPWNDPWKRPFPLWHDSGLINYENDGDWPETGQGEVIAMKLPRNITLTPYMKIKAPAGLKIDIRTDNYIGGGTSNIRAEYITRDGTQEFEALAYLNGHEVHYTIPEGIEILDLKYRETRYNTDFAGAFECDDPFLNKLWIKSRNTMNINMRDAIQDPDRERSQWWGDAVIVMGEMFYACDTNAYGLMRKCMSNLVEWQKPNGVLYSPIPGKWHRELPLQMLASIGLYGFWRYFRYTGDTAMIQYVYPHVNKYLDLWEMGENGLVRHRTGDWDWGDWGINKDRPLMDNAWYVMALEAAVKMAELTGSDKDSESYHQRIEQIRANYHPAFWNGQAYRSPGYSGETDDRGHGLAVVSGLSDPEFWPLVKQVLEDEFHASPYTEKYVLESFFIRHDAGAGIKRMKDRYTAMVNHPWCTTLWEGWGIGPEGYGGGSYNHGWAGGPLILLSEYVAGVAPIEPGYATFQVNPQLGPLKSVSATVPTIHGNIDVMHQLTPESYTTQLNVPENTKAIVGIPSGILTPSARISVNEILIWEYEEPVTSFEGLKYMGPEDHYIKFEVVPGNWLFEAIFAK